MADESSTPAPQGGRNAGNRDGGGFRIRLSDNEMRSARSIQDAFRLRSTVAVLGFSVRTIAQLLEEGKLDELVAQAQAQAGPRRDGARDGGRREGGRGEGRGARQDRQAPRVNPFARPARPAAAATEPAAAAVADPEPEAQAVPQQEPPAEDQAGAASEAPNATEAPETEATDTGETTGER